MHISRYTIKTAIRPTQMEDRCLNTWTTWLLETPLTSEDLTDSWCIRAMVQFVFFSNENRSFICSHQQMALSHCLRWSWPVMSSLCLIRSGQFAIRANKKSEPKVRKFKHVGMIAGGTGSFTFLYDSVTLSTDVKVIVFYSKDFYSLHPVKE